MDDEILIILSKIEHLSDNYKCSPISICEGLEITKIDYILKRPASILTRLKEQVASKKYNIEESKFIIHDSIEILKDFSDYSTKDLHEAFEKNDSINNMGWLGVFICGAGSISFFIASECIKSSPIFSGFNALVAVVGLSVTGTAAYQYHNQITHRISDINYDLIQLNKTLGDIGQFADELL